MKKLFLVLALLASGPVFCMDTTPGVVNNGEGKKLLKESSLVALEVGAAASLMAVVASVLNEKKLSLGLIGECALSSALFAAAYYSIAKKLLKRPAEKAREDADIAGVIFGGCVLRVHYLP